MERVVYESKQKYQVPFEETDRISFSQFYYHFKKIFNMVGITKFADIHNNVDIAIAAMSEWSILKSVDVIIYWILIRRLNSRALSCRIPDQAEDKLDKPAPTSS